MSPAGLTPTLRAMRTTSGVVWREGETPLARGKLELLPLSVRLDGLAGSDLNPETFEIVPQRRPEATVIIIARHVEEQPLRRAEEIAMEHSDKFAGGEVVGVGEKAAGENLER